MKRLVYQLFVIGVGGKVEIFFALSVCAAFAFHPNHFLTLTTAFALPLFFLSEKVRFFLSHSSFSHCTSSL